MAMLASQPASDDGLLPLNECVGGTADGARSMGPNIGKAAAVVSVVALIALCPFAFLGRVPAGVQANLDGVVEFAACGADSMDSCQCLLASDVFGGNNASCTQMDPNEALSKQIQEAMSNQKHCEAMAAITDCAYHFGCLDETVVSKCLTMATSCDIDCEKKDVQLAGRNPTTGAEKELDNVVKKLDEAEQNAEKAKQIAEKAGQMLGGMKQKLQDLSTPLPSLPSLPSHPPLPSLPPLPYLPSFR